MTITPAVAAGGRRRRVALIAILGFTGVSAVVSGALLVAAPDGSLLQADPGVFADTPFGDWRVPGLLLAALVGGGYLATGVWQWRRLPWARGLAIFAGAGLVVFELAELATIGFQPLEAVFAAVGIAVVYANWVYNRGNCMAYQFGVTLWLAPWTWAPYEVKRGSCNCA